MRRTAQARAGRSRLCLELLLPPLELGRVCAELGASDALREQPLRLVAQLGAPGLHLPQAQAAQAALRQAAAAARGRGARERGAPSR